MRNGFNPFPSRNRRFPVPKGILHSFLKNPASARACKGNSHSVACLRDECFARSRDRRPHMPSDTGKAPAFDGAGRGRLPIGKLRGHSPVWWKTPRAAGPSESAASTRSEGKGPKAGQFLTQPPVFLQQLTVFGVELTVFYGKLPALGAFLIQFLQHQRALAAATS